MTSARKVYQVRAVPWAHGFELHITYRGRKFGVTQAETLAEADAMVRDFVAMALDLGVSQDSFDVELLVSSTWRVRPLPRPCMAVEVDGCHELLITPADNTRPRIDLITEKPLPPDETGPRRLVSVIIGTPSGVPARPAVPVGHEPIAVVHVPRGATAIFDNMIGEP